MPKLIAAMERWNAQVQADVPAERLLVWNPADGFEPLCEFLEVDLPDDELPRLNDTKAFREGIIGGALDSVTEWWAEREKTTEGLHGAAVELKASREAGRAGGRGPALSLAWVRPVAVLATREHHR